MSDKSRYADIRREAISWAERFSWESTAAGLMAAVRDDTEVDRVLDAAPLAVEVP
jgi:hypothetical protein